MKHSFYLGLSLLLVLSSFNVYSQTNIFPATGNAGIGTTTPATILEIRKSSVAWWNGTTGYTTPPNTAAIVVANTTAGGYDPALILKMATSTGVLGESAIIGTVGTGAWTNGNSATQISDLYIATRNAGGGVSERMRITSAGKIGIGTTSPIQLLHIRKDQAAYTYIVSDNAGTPGTGTGSGFVNAEGGNILGYFRNERDGTGRQVMGAVGNAPLTFETNSTERIRIKGDGNVGIGTTDPGTYKLNVNGRIRANEVVVNTTGADFVFTPGYKLLSLPEIEKFIKENQHLPDLMPAREMKENGMNVSDMQTKLLQKLEEMTLYIIEQNKTNELQRDEIELLKQQIAILKERNY
jgi:hypothetical protein